VKTTFVALDVDGTLTMSNVSLAFGRFLYQQGRISWFQAWGAALTYAAHRLGLLSIRTLHRRIFTAVFLGKEQRQIEEDAEHFWDEQWQRLVRPSVLALLSTLQGQTIALLSSSPDFLIKGAARRLGLSEWYATEYVAGADGRFLRLGRVVTGGEKAKIIQIVKKKGDSAIMAVTDSMLDLPLLDEADIAVVVSPERKLARLAKERGWRIIES
jgi:HAD superfamily phosphoserine phosphatase-like hydrolase